MEFERLRERMVQQQLCARMLRDARVLEAFRRIPRHLFVPEALRHRAYEDGPLAIGYDQTISQPFMVALMVEALHLQGHERVLEVGTGSGYEAAILSQLALEVYSVERVPELAIHATRQLEALGIANVAVTTGDGTLGWPAHAPYDGILVAAAATTVPPPLQEQLVEGGRLLIPLGTRKVQMLLCVQRHGQTFFERPLTACAFVPLIGQHGWPPG